MAAVVTAALVLATVAVAAPGQVVASAPAPSRDPDAWARACSAGRLGLGEDTVARAPVLAGDTAPDGRPVRNGPASDGSWYPIVMVHGWTSSDTVADSGDRSGAFSHLIDLSSDPAGTAHVSRSLLGQLQGLPGAAVFTFDYHPYSARWVDDNHLGKALGQVIDCLYQQSGQKVALVGHSMGGLIIRWAATHQGLTGADRSAEISTVVTFGTPETGSVAALLAEVGVDFGSVTNNVVAAIRFILSVCGTLSSKEIETGTLCDILLGPVRAFESSAGIALRYGSSQLAALDPWPKGIYLDALAGDTSFETPKVGWFHWPWATDKVTGAGDMIVTKGSATAGAGATKSIHCDYQLNAIRAGTDRLGLLVGLTAASEIAQLPLGSFSGACFHLSLMRSVELTNEALGAIREDLAGRQVRPVTLDELLNAPVPALRGNPAQNMVNGKIPHPRPGGDVGLITTGSGAPAYGDLTGDGVPDAAAAVLATAGAGGGEDYVQLYTNGHHRLGMFDPGAASHRQHGIVLAMIVRDQQVLLDWQAYDGAGFNYTFGSAHLRWDGSRIVVSQLADHTGATSSGFWSDPLLTLRSDSLGAVHIGMPWSKLADAVGTNVNPVGDGVSYPQAAPKGYYAIHIAGGYRDSSGISHGSVSCIGINGTPAPNQRITTPEGFQLAQTVGRLKQLYGSALKYVPNPYPGGLSPKNGYVLPNGPTELVFAWYDRTPGIDRTEPSPNQAIEEIFAARIGTGPSGCPG